MIRLRLPNPARRFFKKNPTPTQWALIATGGAFAIGVGAYGVVRYRRRRAPAGQLPVPPPTDIECDPRPYTWDGRVVQARANELADEGQTDMVLVAQTIASEQFGRHPSGAAIVFPPGPNAPAGTACVWSLVQQVVAELFADRGIVPPPTGPTGSLSWVYRTSGDPGYPWEEPVLHVENWPTPGMFVDVGNENGAWDPSSGFDSMVRAALGSALVMANLDPAIATAQGQDPDASIGQSLRKQMRQAITHVGGTNDLAYGQTNLNYAGGNDPNAPGGDPNKAKSGAYVLNAAHRGLNWLPRHADQVARIQNGQSLLRTTSLAGEKLPGLAGHRHMLVWIPAIDVDALGVDLSTLKFMQWSDGTSTIEPPPQVQALGVDLSGVVLPGVAVQGMFAPHQ